MTHIHTVCAYKMTYKRNDNRLSFLLSLCDSMNDDPFTKNYDIESKLNDATLMYSSRAIIKYSLTKER